MIHIYAGKPESKNFAVFDFTGTTLTIIVRIFTIYPYLFWILLTIFRLDPLHQISEHFISCTIFRTYILPILKFCELFALIQTCRIGSMFTILVSILGILFAHVLAKIGELSHRISMGRDQAKSVTMLYLHVEIILTLLSELSDVCLAVVLGFGILISVVFNFVTLKMYRFVPMPLYLFFPMVSILIPVIIWTLLPQGINIYEASVMIRSRWERLAIISLDKKYLTRRIQAVKSLQLYAGLAGFNFFRLQKSTKSTLFWYIASYTVTALLSIKVRGGNGFS